MLKLALSNLEFQNFPGEDRGPPLQGEGREGGRNGGGEGRGGEGGALDMGSAPLETNSGSAPWAEVIIVDNTE